MKKMTLQFGLPLILLLQLIGCASNDVEKELSVSEKKAIVFYEQGTNDLVKKNYHGALTNLLKAKEFDPKNTKVRNNLGMAYYFREQMNFAIEELKESISLDNKNTDAKQNLATIFLEQNNLKEAEKLYQECSKDLTYVALHRVHYNLAILNLKRGDRKTAFEELSLAIKEREDYCQAHYKMGELYTEEYRYKEALQAYRKSTLGTCVKNPEPHYAVALALLNLSRQEEAKNKLKEIIEKFPNTNFKLLASNKLKSIKEETYQENSNNDQMTDTSPSTPKF